MGIVKQADVNPEIIARDRPPGPVHTDNLMMAVIGFVKPAHAALVAEDICKTYRKQHSDVAGQTAVYLAETAVSN